MVNCGIGGNMPNAAAAAAAANAAAAAQRAAGGGVKRTIDGEAIPNMGPTTPDGMMRPLQPNQGGPGPHNNTVERRGLPTMQPRPDAPQMQVRILYH